MRVDRYHLGKRMEPEAGPSSDPAIPQVGLSVWETTDPLFGDVPVSLHLIAVTDENADAIASLRSEASTRAKGPSVDVRVFEDLQLGLVGAAYRAKGPAKKTQVDGAAAPPQSVTSSSSIRLLKVLTTAIALSIVGLVALRLLRDDRDARRMNAPEVEIDEEVPEGDTPEEATEGDRATSVTQQPAPRAATCPGTMLAIASGCIDREPVSARELAACKRCPSAIDSVPRPLPLSPESEADDRACIEAAGRPGGSARCVRYAQAEAYCAERGGALPSLAGWITGRDAGMKQGQPYEWTTDKFKAGGMMRLTGEWRGRSKQNHVALATPTLGFRCTTPR